MKTILVVDDNIDLLEDVARKLMKHIPECKVVTAVDGLAGEAILMSTPIEFLLTDLAMPVLDGYAVIERTRKLYPWVPICVMSADCSPTVVRKLRSLGVGRWIEKPFTFKDVARIVVEELGLTYNN